MATLYLTRLARDEHLRSPAPEAKLLSLEQLAGVGKLSVFNSNLTALITSLHGRCQTRYLEGAQHISSKFKVQTKKKVFDGIRRSILSRYMVETIKRSWAEVGANSVLNVIVCYVWLK